MDNDARGRNDGEIVRQILAGDVDAFEHLLMKYQDPVMRIVKKHVPVDCVKDLAQEVFLRAYQSLSGFQGANFQQWLKTIAVRTCYDFWRSRPKFQELPVSFLEERQTGWLQEALSERAHQVSLERLWQAERRDLLAWALDHLSAEDRMVLELVYLEGLSIKEAAGLLGWSSAAVKVRSFRSRHKLHRLLSRELKKRRK